MSMFGEINFFVGLQVYQLRYDIFVTQSKYIKEILKIFGLEDSKLMSTPMIIGHKLSKNYESSEVNQTPYRSMISNLQYVLHNKLDITLSVRIVARFSTNPRENHLIVVKRIMRYLQGTKQFGLYYKKNEQFDLTAQTDVDWGGEIDDRK